MIRRLWSLPLWAHALALLVAVSAAVAFARPGVPFFSDEGSVVAQARLLADDGTWIYRPTTVVADPEGAARPFQNGDLGTEGLAPYAKHPLYPLALSVVTGGSATGAVVVSVLAAVLAALLAAAVALRIAPDQPGVARAVLWSVGAASPLLFAAGLVVAHTLAATVAVLVVWAAMAVVRPVGSRRVPTAVGMTAVVAVGCAVAGMLRTEAVFLGPAVAVAVVAAAWRAERLRVLAVGVVAVAGSVLSRLIDREWSRSIVGTALPAPTDNPVPSTGSWVLDRLHGVYSTVVQAGYSLTRADEIVRWAAVALLVVAALAWRGRRLATRPALIVAAGGALLYALGTLTGPARAVPGLLVAFPLLAVGLVLLDRRVLADPVARVPTVVALVCVAGIVLTQYPNGGGLEWGWRYSTFVLPVATPPVVWAAALTLRARPDARRFAAPALVLALVVAAVPVVVAVRAQAESHRADRQLAAAIAAVAADAPGPEDRTVVLSWNRFLPQLLVAELDRYDWVVPDRASLPEYAARLADAGVDRVVLVGPDAAGVVDDLGADGWRLVASGPAAPYDVVVIGR